ncbi:MAG: serine/threonine-protein kinase [Kofleriaceae bacterium]
MSRPSSIDDPTLLDGGPAPRGAPAVTTGPSTVARAVAGRLRADEALTIATDFEQRYELGDELARGGLAAIRDAYDRVLHRRVAVKQLLTRDGGADVRFLREARVTARLAHPNIVPVYDLGLDADGAPFYAMKWVLGRSLHELIEDRATLDERLALLPHVVAIADALSYAHAVGVIHRDLKPANVLVGDYGETIVIDWGLALERGQRDEVPVAAAEATSSPRLTSVGTVIGTPAYMPPEQARGEEVDEAADVYALGATLYQVITGQYPYQAEHESGASDDPVWVQVIDHPPRGAAELCPAAPSELCAIVERAMARRPSERYPSVADLGAAVASFLSHHQSYRLADAAVQRDAQLAVRMRAVVTSDAAAVAEVYREADVVRFGIEQALAGWRDNPLALQALARFNARMFDFECAVGNLAAAAALARALPPDPDRERMLLALRTDLARRDAEAAAFARAGDRSVGGRERTIMLAVVGAMLTYFLVEAVVTHRSLTDHGALRRLFRNSLIVAVPTLTMMFVWRRKMFANEFSRRAGRAVAAMMAATVVHRAMAMVVHQPPAHVYVFDNVLIAVAMVTFGTRVGVAVGAVATVAAGVSAYHTSAALYIFHGLIIGTAALLSVAWTRAARDRA